MGADGYALLLRDAERARHDFRIARVQAAGDVSRGDDVQESFVLGEMIGPISFAKVRINIYRTHGLVPPERGCGRPDFRPPQTYSRASFREADAALRKTSC